MVTEYTRVSYKLDGDFRVHLYRAFIGSRSFTLTLSHYTKMEKLLSIITNKIANSIRNKNEIKKEVNLYGGTPISEVQTPQISEQRELPIDQNQGSGDWGAGDLVYEAQPANEALSEWKLFLALSFVITWTIGLTPPALIRFVFLKRPIGKWPAIGICGVMFLVNLLIFMPLDSQGRPPTAVMLIAVISYYILRKAVKEVSVVENN